LCDQPQRSKLHAVIPYVTRENVYAIFDILAVPPVERLTDIVGERFPLIAPTDALPRRLHTSTIVSVALNDSSSYDDTV
jgi:hypothetical protein